MSSEHVPAHHGGRARGTNVDGKEATNNSKGKRTSYNPLAVSDIRREDILRHVFGDVGKLVDDFSCAVESTVLLHGRMYVTTRFLCFYSNLFGLEKKIRIPYSHITAISKENTALVIPNAIAISTIRKEYIFRSFWDRDECFRMLKEHIKGIGMTSERRHGLDGTKNSSLHGYTMKRGDGPLVNSPPRNREAALDMMLKEDGGTDTGESHARGDSTHTAYSVDDGASFTPSMSSSSPRSRAQTGENIDNDQDINLNNESSDNEDDRRALSDADTEGDGSPEGEGEGEGDDEIVEQTEWESGKDPRIVSSDEAGAGHFSPVQVTEAIARATLKIEVDKKLLRVSVTDFAKMFVEDSAPYSWSKYHESVGDSQLSASPWNSMSAADLGHLGSGREIKFFKPVNLPGLKDTRGVKLQKYQRFGGQGLIVHSSTRLEDVPAADTFTVEDVVTVRRPEPSEMEEIEGGQDLDHYVMVSTSFEVRFIKSTFLRYMIESNTVTEMTKWLQAWFRQVDDRVAERVGQTEQKLASIKKMLSVHTKGAGHDDSDDSGDEDLSSDDVAVSEGGAGGGGDQSGQKKARRRSSLKAAAKRIRRLSSSVKELRTSAKILIGEAFSSWQRVEGRRFFVFCFALLLILSAMMYWQLRHVQASMDHMHFKIAGLMEELVALREELGHKKGFT